jgi:hypothetical protein
MEKQNDKYVLRHKICGGVQILELSARDLRILKRSGWVFVNINAAAAKDFPKTGFGLTCVGFAKRCMGLRAPLVQTPLQLYRMIKEAAK